MNHPLKDLTETQKRVYKLLENNPHLRDEDATLVASMHITEMGGIEKAQQVTAYDYMGYLAKGKLTKYETITRARRNLQAKYPALRGSKYKERKILEEDYRITIKSL
jgi:hypothetical protein